ncbi:MAG: biotin--[acetyl-CoA-carboxylase] ligase [bacterium]
MLGNKLIGRTLLAFNKLGSSNEVAKRLAKKQASEGTTILAEQQTGGRGRQQKKWFSPPSTGLWFSVILKPQCHLDRLGLISLLACVAVSDAVKSELGLRLAHKWPNDLLSHSRKVCGILIETEFTSQKLSHLVLGIGINVNQMAADFPEELMDTATSLRMETGVLVDRRRLLIAVLRALEKCYLNFLQRRFDLILRKWRDGCPFFQRTISVATDGGRVEGLLEDIDEFGRLCLRLPSERTIVLSVGDILLRNMEAIR